MEKKPYIGVTGFMTPQEVRFALRSAEEFNLTRQLMVGVLASSKTLDYRPNKWPGRYPKPDRIAEIFQNHPLALNLIHYATDDPTTLCRQLVRMTELAGKKLHGFQLNVAWPNQNELYHFRKTTDGEMRIVLQIGSKAMAAFGNHPAQIAQVVTGYRRSGFGHDLIDDVLIDSSGGKGVPFDPAFALPILREIGKLNPGLGLGVAGGLSPANIDVLSPLLQECPELSIDAEGQLREKQHDDLDLGEVWMYLQKAGVLYTLHAA